MSDNAFWIWGMVPLVILAIAAAAVEVAINPGNSKQICCEMVPGTTVCERVPKKGEFDADTWCEAQRIVWRRKNGREAEAVKAESEERSSVER